MTEGAETRAESDISTKYWLFRVAPDVVKPYLLLARVDRPIGTWLLLLPCWWGAALAGGDAIQLVYFALLFAIGAFAMRGAGCVWNDILDRDYDAKVARTAMRPIANGTIGVPAAAVFMACLSGIGLCVLLQCNQFAIVIALSSMVLVALYPLMKRITYWPQAWLGLTFNWGALVGWAAVAGSL
ncbi:MAG: 4-hydroxybenzoate octaprenyltransferase, partial [Alphaproteobacteria bacterium MarineAlpha4_Bin2]